MIAVLDAAYRADVSAAACVQARDWDAPEPAFETAVRGGAPAAYEPGEFYRRELPLLLAALKAAPGPPDAILIDGYVWLDVGGRAGLGAHLHAAIDRVCPVIGLAKTRFVGAETFARPLLRGRSRSPLFITAAGVTPEAAAEAVARMQGAARLPDLVARADRLARAALT